MKNFCLNCKLKETKEVLKSGLFSILRGKIPIIVCIGTDAVSGDSLGPMVGSRLKESLAGKTFVFGSLDNPITAKDVGGVAEFVKTVYSDCEILAIDAALGKKEEIGYLKLTDSAIKPGLGVDKELSEVGTSSIIGIVEEKVYGKKYLSSVRLSIVYDEAQVIVDAINEYVDEVLSKRAVFKTKTV